MTEKEKGQAGLPYNPNFDPELTKERGQAKELCFAYNQTNPSNQAKREKIIRKLIKKTGEKFLIEQPFFCDYGYNLEIGENFYANHNLVLLDGAKITFGNNVFIGPNCGFYSTNHPLDKEKRNEGLEQVKPITIGNNVWIGGNSVILQGVTIGENTVIGAGSIVTKDIPANVVALGNPCRVIKPISHEG